MEPDEATAFSQSRFLTTADYFEWRQRAMRRARQMRSEQVVILLAGLGAATRRAACAVRNGWRRLQRAIADRNAIVRLHSLDDSALIDLGIRRSEIESLVRGEGADPTRLRRPRSLDEPAKAA